MGLNERTANKMSNDVQYSALKTAILQIIYVSRKRWSNVSFGHLERMSLNVMCVQHHSRLSSLYSFHLTTHVNKVSKVGALI